MGATQSGRLRVHGQGEIRLSEVRAFLGDIERAYGSLYAFEVVVDGWQRAARELEDLPWPMARITVPLLFWGAVPRVHGRARYLVSWPPLPEEVATVVPPRDRLVLAAVQLHSPGAWDFLGKLNPLEVIRQYLCDRHERRKDKNYREAAERRRLELENQMLEGKVLKEKIGIAKSLGATDADLAPLLNELVLEPLRRLGIHQGAGVIEAAELVHLEASTSEREPNR